MIPGQLTAPSLTRVSSQLVCAILNGLGGGESGCDTHNITVTKSNQCEGFGGKSPAAMGSVVTAAGRRYYWKLLVTDLHVRRHWCDGR